MIGYLVDTDIWINVLRGEKVDSELLYNLDAPIGLSVYTLTELLAGYRTPNERAQINDLQSLLRVYPVSEEIAAIAGEMLHSNRDKGVGVVDATNAAICVQHGLIIVTHNLKHYTPFQPQLFIFTGN